MADLFLSTVTSTNITSRVFARVAVLARAVIRAYDRYRQRQHLAGLDARMLADLGLSRNDVEAECRKSWWPV
jgi:uncharacterized protein YjiS (DUF1127 family)